MYAVYAPGINGGEKASSGVYADDFLYDLAKDPNQLENITASPEYRDIKQSLRKRLLDWIERAEGYRPVIRD
jgi:uncharacterized sulfatase